MLDTKTIVIALLLGVLFLAKFLGGNRPYDTPARRRRRYGIGGTVTREQIKNAPPSPPEDPEKDFFGDDEKK